MIQDKNKQALIISMPGAFRESLRVTLEAMPGMNVIGLAGGGLSATEMVRERNPDVVVINADVSEDEVLAFVRDMKISYPQTRLVVLTNTLRQKSRVLEWGADAVLSRWSSARELAAAVTNAQY